MDVRIEVRPIGEPHRVRRRKPPRVRRVVPSAKEDKSRLRIRTLAYEPPRVVRRGRSVVAIKDLLFAKGRVPIRLKRLLRRDVNKRYDDDPMFRATYALVLSMDLILLPIFGQPPPLLFWAGRYSGPGNLDQF